MSFIKESFNSWYHTNFKNFILDKAGFKKLGVMINKLYLLKPNEIFPMKKDLFNAFKYCNYDDLKVVIIGQDPYHDQINKNPVECRATGVAFANNDKILKPISPSLKNIMKEVEEQYPEDGIFTDVTLMSWVKQGVLLLNTALTVEKGNPGVHMKLWKPFTDKVVEYLCENKQGLIFILWGNHASQFKEIIEKHSMNGHWILESAHPSPLSAHKGFFGNNHFLRANHILYLQGKQQIKWLN